MKTKLKAAALALGLGILGASHSTVVGTGLNPESAGGQADGQAPAGMPAASWSSIQAQIAAARYDVADSTDDRKAAANLKQGFQLAFGFDGLELVPRSSVTRGAQPAAAKADAAWKFSLQTRSLCRGAACSTSEPVKAESKGNRVTYPHPRLGLEEWYVNTAQGLEHGYTLDRAPPASLKGEQVEIVLAARGLRASATAGGEINFAHGGKTVLSYGKLVVTDADGTTLPSTLSVFDEGRAVRIAFGDSAARYPVTVDPLIQSVTLEATADGVDAEHDFGTSVALSETGTTLIVGDQYALGNYVGAAYVFVDNAGTWVLQQRLTALKPREDDQFGISVALSGDTALVGAPFDEAVTGSGSRPGSVYAFVRNGGTWTLQQKFTGDVGDRTLFGYAVALSGDTATIGAPYGNAAFVFTRTAGGVWLEQQKLTAPEGSSTNDNFGWSVALSGNTLLTGAWGYQGHNGAAYVYVNDGTSWQFQQKLVGTGTTSSDAEWFGFSVALSGDTALIGAPTQQFHGKAYVFTRTGSAWTIENEFGPSANYFSRLGYAVALQGGVALISDPGYSQQCSPTPCGGAVFRSVRSGTTWSAPATILIGGQGDFLGSALALAGDVAAVGDTSDGAIPGGNNGLGAVYVRRLSTGTTQKLTAADGGAYNFFGYSVSVSGNTLLVGVPGDDTTDGSAAGSAYVFTGTGAAWTLQQQLTTPTTNAQDYFGLSVALDGDTALVGAPRDQFGGVATGTAYVFIRSGAMWSLQQRLIAADRAAGDTFGYSVGLSGDTALIGAPQKAAAAGIAVGAAYVFVRSGGAWTEQQKLVDPAGTPGDFLGLAAALSADTAFVGAPSGGSNSTGLTHVFKRNGSVWSLEQTLTPSASSNGAYFGSAIALSGESALIGAFGTEHPIGGYGGAAYVYVLNNGIWEEQQKLVPLDTSPGQTFGGFVALASDTAVIGAVVGYSEGTAYSEDPTAYVFVRDEATWNQLGKLTVPDASGRAFSLSVGAHSFKVPTVAVSGDTVMVGTYMADTADGVDAGTLQILTIPYDYGDAPAPYPTLRADNGPRHGAGGILQLGAAVDSENDGQPNSGAVGDDLAGSDDEDGLTFGTLSAGGNGTVDVAASGPGFIDAWMDFNADGDWSDPGEQIFFNEPVQSGANALAFPVAQNAVVGDTYTRFRLSSAGVNAPIGSVADGEVEDQQINILPDSTPAAFSFADQTGVEPSATVTSATITISGLQAPSSISVGGGSYSVGCTGTFTTNSGSISNGQTVCVRHTASSAFSTATDTILTIGGMSDTFTSTTRPADTAPDAFSFTDLTGVEPMATVTSSSVTVSGIEDGASVSVTGGSYSLGCTGSFTSSNGSVNSGQTVCVQHLASMAYMTATDTILTIGGMSDTFTSTTRPADTVPDAFSFIDLTGVEPMATVTSSSVTVSGIEDGASVSVTGGSYSLGCTGSFTSSNGSVNSGQTVCVRHLASMAYMTATNTVLTIGGVADTFTSTTRAADVTPAQFTFTDQTGVAASSQITSAPITISGIEAGVPISVAGGSYSIGCTATFVTNSSTVNSGQTVCVRHTSASAESSATDTVLTAGGVSDTFTSTTASLGVDTVPDAFSFSDVSLAEPGSVNESNVITVGGINGAASISIAGAGEFRVGTAGYGTSAATVSNGQTVQLRISAPAFGQSASATLTIGGVSDAFTVASRASNEAVVTTPDGEPASVTSTGGALMNLSNSATMPTGTPTGFSFPDGFFTFDVTGLTIGATVTVTLTLPADSAPNAYIKCNAAGTVCAPFAGAAFAGNVVTLTLTDGGAGDGDGIANGSISDPGAPAVSASPAVGATGDGGGGALSWFMLMMLLVGRGLRVWSR